MNQVQAKKSLTELLKEISKACGDGDTGPDFDLLSRLFVNTELLKIFEGMTGKEMNLFPLLWKAKQLWQSFWFNLGPQNDLEIFDGSSDKELKAIFYHLRRSIENAMDDCCDNSLASAIAFNKAVLAYYSCLSSLNKEL